VGILALQGAVREHADAVRALGAEAVLVRLPSDLQGLDALILPGGESTTMRRLIDRYGLREPILAMAREGRPMLGTCAGMILLSSRTAGARSRCCPCST
jgi:5'-phosphate synthase pdxT subunit